MSHESNLRVPGEQLSEPQPIQYALGSHEELTALHAELNKGPNQYWGRSGHFTDARDNQTKYAVFVKVKKEVFTNTRDSFDLVTKHLSEGRATGGTAWRMLHNPKTDYSKIPLTAKPATLLTLKAEEPSADTHPSPELVTDRPLAARLGVEVGRLGVDKKVRAGLRTTVAASLIAVGLVAALVNLSTRNDRN